MSQFKQYLKENIQRALNEQMRGGVSPRPIGPPGNIESGWPTWKMPQPLLDRSSSRRLRSQGPESPKPLPVSKAFMEQLYGWWWPSIAYLLSQIMGPDWFNQWQNIIHDGSWNWPGWTEGANGLYYLEFGGGYWQVQFVDGSWMFNFAQP